MKVDAKTPFLYAAIIYGCSFFLFMEWIYPLNEVTDTAHLSVFIFYTVFCFLITLLQLNWIVSFFIKGAGALFVVHTLFLEASVFSREWMHEIWVGMLANIQLLQQQEWYQLTPMFRSLLFLILIWLMSYLLYYWFVTMKHVLVFIILTVVYVTLLDTFTTYDATFAIVRTVILSLIALGFTSFTKEVGKEKLKPLSIRQAYRFITPILAMVLLAVAAGFIAPKQSAQWPDPVPFLQDITNTSGAFGLGSSGRTVGYGEDDSTLGGSFKQDHTPVFEAKVDGKHYWRVETKDVYTGKGWEKAEEESFERQDQGKIRLNSLGGDVKEAAIDFSGEVNLEKLVYPYGLNEVTARGEESDILFFLDESYGVVEPWKEGQKTHLPSYDVTFAEPSYDIDKLKETGKGDDPQDIAQAYTQLPDDLPERVDGLAQEITENHSNRYDKAKAIEQYFGRSGFTYQVSNIPIPEEDEDYVDQFLYESKKGYCDNYSTSMVVMLRTLGIPARWAKGFTGGEKTDEEEIDGESLDVYEITNANAHSWPEVFFPEVGWVPFEPTQGFSNYADFHRDVEPEDDDMLDAEQAPDEEPEMDEPENEPPEADMEEETEENGTAGKTDKQDASLWKWILPIALAAFIVTGLLLYLFRYRIRAFLVERRLRNGHNQARAVQDAYHYLLDLLGKQGLPREADQTLREYARRIDRRFGETNMSKLTAYYEQILYNQGKNPHKSDQFQDIWKELVERVRKA